MERSNDSTAQAVEQKNLVQSDSLNLASLSAQTDNGPTKTANNDDKAAAQCREVLKSFPQIDLYDGQSAVEVNAYKAAIAKTMPQATEGTKPADSKVGGKDPLASCFDGNGFPIVNTSDLKGENKNSINQKETPRFSGASSWAKLEGYSLENK